MSEAAINPLEGVFRRSTEIDEETFEEDLLLLHQRLRSVVVLNPTAAAVWEALKWPQSCSDLAELFVEACAGMDRDVAATQVAETVRQLVDLGFVLRADP